MRMRVVLLSAGLAAGCGGGGMVRPAPQPEDTFGAYRFSQRMSEDGSLLEGQFIITRDTIIVRPVTGHCDYEPNETDQQIAAAHGTQLTGHFLIDRQGIIRWAHIEAGERPEDLLHFPTEEEILRAARSL